MTKAELYQKACMLPLLPGVYIIRDKSDTIIYIGKAKRLRIRVSQYFREGVPHDNKVSQMIAHAYAFTLSYVKASSRRWCWKPARSRRTPPSTISC